MAGEDSTVSGVAGRYARALFELALESKSVDAVKSDIEKFDALMRESEDLRFSSGNLLHWRLRRTATGTPRSRYLLNDRSELI